ncbi:MAG: transketolase family protein [Candidatus Woesearchaeota archaeon]|jgi:transketolase|nr:transketolase family protein [Candidatus Woesearchaeota archaeon]MDP7458109.1 transketolase family protein [Candidatus Woesearchaeota archaeon]
MINMSDNQPPVEKATREGYGDALVEIGKDERIVALDADLSKSTNSSKFQEKYPDRFFNLGISEQDLIGTAAGLAASGKISYASSFAVFITGRAYGQIRLMAGISKLNMRVVGSHAGILTGEDGASHQATEDISLMRAIPNMTVIQPADYNEAISAVKASVDYKGPIYLRLGRGKVPSITNNDQKFEIGKGTILKEGKDVTIIATGALVHIALEAHEKLKEQNINAKIINIHTIKPIDKELIISSARETKAIVTAEDHNIIGGLGSAVAEVLSENIPTPLERVGMMDTFGESGTPKELYEHYNLTPEQIIKAVKNTIKRK